jgi:hypothetical protein
MAEAPEQSGRGKWLALAAVCVLTAAVAVSLGLLRQRSYPQNSPEALLTSARQMVLDGRADRLPDLVWTSDPGMRPVFKRLGRLLGNLQTLGRTVGEAFPDEIAEVRRAAEETAARGEGASVIAQMLTGQGGLGGQGGQRGQRGRRSSDASFGGGMEDRLNTALRELFADPYGWLARSEGRLTTEYVTDDIVGLAWDGQGVVGLQIVERDGKWYLDSPTNLPVVKRLIPADADTYRILESLVATLDNAVRDLDREVKAGEIRNLASLASEAGEKAAPMFLFGVIAYGKFLEERQRLEREARAQAQQQTPPAAAGSGTPPGGQ